MAHFAWLDENNIVYQVSVVNNSDLLDENGEESEEKGIYCFQFDEEDIMRSEILKYIVATFKKLDKTNINCFLGGSASGFIAGMVGTGGAVRGIVMSAFAIEKEIFVAT